MNIEQFDYGLPNDLIANEPSFPRDECKLLFLNRNDSSLKDLIFRDILKILNKDCVLVLNDTKVFPARLYGKKESGGKTEILLLQKINGHTYTAIGKGNLKPGQNITFSVELSAKILSKNNQGEMEIAFNKAGEELENQINQVGQVPLPPYIHSNLTEQERREKYQTVYAQDTGSAAAPTAGLHFTNDLLESLQKSGVEIEKITLHVGLGTFKPVDNKQIEDGQLHFERGYIHPDVANKLNHAKRSGKKIIAVGTTTTRLLESQCNEDGLLISGPTDTNIFIQPGYKFKFVDGLITNFHLPKTSLLMMISSFVSYPNTTEYFHDFSTSMIGRAYEQAISSKYHFFSFGDAMLIL